MPISMLIARLRFYIRETLVFILVFAALFMSGVWTEHHISTISTAFLEDSLDELGAANYQIRLVNDSLFHPDTESTIKNLFADVPYDLHKLLRTAGLTCGVERNCHQGFALREPDRYIRVIEGDFPQDTGTRAEVQVLIGAEIARLMQFTTGSTFIFSSNQGTPIRVEVSGIFEPIDADAPIWNLNDILLTGINTVIGGGERYDYGFMVTDSVFDTVLDPASQAFRGSVYTWLIETEPVAPSLMDVVERRNTLQAFEQAFFQQNPIAQFVTRSLSRLDAINNTIGQTIQQVRVLSGLMVLLFAGYGAYLHHRGILRQIEWRRIPEMGFQPATMLHIRLQMLALLAVSGSLLGCVIGVILWEFPLVSGIGYGFLAVIVGYVLIAVAGQSTMPKDNRTHHTSFIFDAQLDVVLLFVAVVLLVRLFALSAAGITSVIQTGLSASSQIFTLIDPSLAHAPLNLVIPFVLAGAILLLILRLVVVNLRIDNQDSVSLMVLLGLTMMVGVVSALLAITLDAEQRQIAAQRTGGAARILLDNNSDFRMLDEIGAYSGLVMVKDESNTGNVITLIGIDDTQFREAFPEYAFDLNALFDAEALPLVGFPLPDDAVSLSLDVYSMPDDTIDGDVQIGLRLLDGRGVATIMNLSPVTDPIAEAFVRYQANIPITDYPPYRLNGIVVDVERGDELTFEHTFFFDDLTLYRDNDVIEVLEDFEAEGLPDGWDIPTGSGNNITSHLRFTSPARGEGSLRSTVRILNGRPVIIPFGIVAADYHPVIVSRQFVERVMRETEDARSVIGDNQQEEFNFNPGVYNLRYQVVDVLDFFPVVEDTSFIIMPQRTLLYFLNNRSDVSRIYDVSEIWVNQPSNPIDESVRVQLPDTTQYLDDLYQQMKAEPYPTTMITLMQFVFIMGVILAVPVLLVTHIGWQQILVIVASGIFIGLASGIILRMMFPIFSIV